MKNLASGHVLTVVAAFLVGGVFIGFAFGYSAGWLRAPAGQNGSSNGSISNFKQCADAGYPIMESYPRQCRANGQTFTEVVDTPIPVEPDGGIGNTPGSGGCIRAGCSGQVCADAKDAANLVTTCEYRQEYACYQSAKCERQGNGSCGWTQTASLRACLSNPPPLK